MRVPKLGKKDYLGLGLMMWLAMLTEIVGYCGVEFFHTNMNLGVNIFCLINLPLGLWFYQRRIEWLSKTGVIVISLIYILIGLFNLFFYQGITVFNSYTATILQIGFMCLSAAYFAALFFQHNEYLTVRGMFWINTAVLLYSTGTFFIHLLIHYLVTLLHSNLVVVLITLNSFGVVYYAMIAYGLNKIRREYLSRITSI